MNSETLICIWILAFPIGIIQVSTPRKWSFLLYFSSFDDYWHPTTLISLVHNSLGEMEWCEKRAFQLFKMRKMKVSWNIKTKWVTNFYRQLGLRVWRIILVITCGGHKRQTFTLISIKLMWVLKFFFTRNRVFKHKGFFSKLNVFCKDLGKMWASYIFHFFTKNSKLHTYEKNKYFLHNICRDA